MIGSMAKRRFPPMTSSFNPPIEPPPPRFEEFTSFETYIFDCDGVIWGISDEAMRFLGFFSFLVVFFFFTAKQNQELVGNGFGKWG